jgi:hypothetical protein
VRRSFGQKAVETTPFDFGFPSGRCEREGVSGCEQWCEQCEHVHTRVLVQLAPTKLVAAPPKGDVLSPGNSSRRASGSWSAAFTAAAFVAPRTSRDPRRPSAVRLRCARTRARRSARRGRSGDATPMRAGGSGPLLLEALSLTQNDVADFRLPQLALLRAQVSIGSLRAYVNPSAVAAASTSSPLWKRRSAIFAACPLAVASAWLSRSSRTTTRGLKPVKKRGKRGGVFHGDS